jgi:hypothetical protein
MTSFEQNPWNLHDNADWICHIKQGLEAAAVCKQPERNAGMQVWLDDLFFGDFRLDRHFPSFSSVQKKSEWSPLHSPCPVKMALVTINGDF